MWKVRLFGYAEVTVTRKYKEKQAFLLHFTRFSVIWLRRSYCHSEMQRKASFPFALHSFFRNFAKKLHII